MVPSVWNIVPLLGLLGAQKCTLRICNDTYAVDRKGPQEGCARGNRLAGVRGGGEGGTRRGVERAAAAAAAAGVTGDVMRPGVAGLGEQGDGGDFGASDLRTGSHTKPGLNGLLLITAITCQPRAAASSNKQRPYPENPLP